MSNGLIDPWNPSFTSSELIDPWDAAVAQQQSSALPTAALPSTPLQTDAPIPLVASDLNPLPTSQVQQKTPAVAPSTQTKETPLSTYLILGTVVSVLGFLAWKYYRKDGDDYAEPEGGVDDLGDLDALENVATYALPVSEKHYFMVSEIGKSGKRIKVQFPESGAVVAVDPEDLLSVKEAEQQGLEER